MMAVRSFRAEEEELQEANRRKTLILLNTIFVVGLVAFTTVNVLQVDDEIARGWTWVERCSRLASANWEVYEANLADTPVLTKTAINAAVYAVAEWLSQVLGGASWNQFCLKRVLRNSAIGAFFGPLVCGYYNWSDALLPPQDPANVPWKILMDQTIYCASKYSAYLYLSGLASGSSVHECQEEVTSKLWPTLTTGWKFWPAVHLITYNIIPPRHRVLWINMVDLAWVTFLSMVARQGSGNEQQPVLEEEEEEEGPTARRAPARGGGRQALKASRR